MATYGASKRAASHLESAAAIKVRGDGVRVGMLSPGIVATDRLLSSDPPPLKIRWLTGTKAFRRFLLAPLRKRDLFADIPTPTPTA